MKIFAHGWYNVKDNTPAINFIAISSVKFLFWYVYATTATKKEIDIPRLSYL